MGLLNSILPHPQTPTNISPNTEWYQRLGHTVATNLPYGAGLGYDALGTIWHLINGTAGNYGPAPSLIGRLAQIFNPGFQQTSGLPANLRLPTDDPDYGNPNYIGLGDPVQAQGQQPQAPPAPPNAAGGPGAAGDLRNVLNSGRFTNAPPFSQTVAQAMFPGSAIGPWGGGITNPYQGQFVHPSGGTDASPIASAFSSWVNARNIK